MLLTQFSFDPVDFRVHTIAELAAGGWSCAAVEAIALARQEGLNALMTHSACLRDLMFHEREKFSPVISQQGEWIVRNRPTNPVIDGTVLVAQMSRT